MLANDHSDPPSGSVRCGMRRYVFADPDRFDVPVLHLTAVSARTRGLRPGLEEQNPRGTAVCCPITGCTDNQIRHVVSV